MKEVLIGSKENGAIIKLSDKGELFIQELFGEDDIEISVHLTSQETRRLMELLADFYDVNFI